MINVCEHHNKMNAQLKIIVASAIAICAVLGIATPFVIASANSLSETIRFTTVKLGDISDDLNRLPALEDNVTKLQQNTDKRLETAFERLRTVETLQAEIGADMRALKEAVLDIRALLQAQSERDTRRD